MALQILISFAYDSGTTAAAKTVDSQHTKGGQGHMEVVVLEGMVQHRPPSCRNC